MPTRSAPAPLRSWSLGRCPGHVATEPSLPPGRSFIVKPWQPSCNEQGRSHSPGGPATASPGCTGRCATPVAVPPTDVDGPEPLRAVFGRIAHRRADLDPGCRHSCLPVFLGFLDLGQTGMSAPRSTPNRSSTTRACIGSRSCQCSSTHPTARGERHDSQFHTPLSLDGDRASVLAVITRGACDAAPRAERVRRLRAQPVGKSEIERWIETPYFLPSASATAAMILSPLRSRTRSLPSGPINTAPVWG